MSIKGEKSVLWLTLILLTVFMYWPIFSSGRLPGGEMSDTVAQGYPFFSYTAERLASFELPLWNPRILCGTPFYESFSAPVFYPLRGLPMLLFGPEAAIRFLFPTHLLLAGFFSWLLLKSAGISRWGSLTGAVAYSAGAWANTLFYAGHGSKVICWAWFPLVLWAVVRFAGTKKLRYIGLGALAVGMQGLSSHPQMMLYTGGSALLVCLFLTKKPVAKSLIINIGGLLGILALGGALAAVQLYPGYVFSRHTQRGEDLSPEAAASYSLPPEETLTMLMPGMFGLRHGFTDSSVNGIPVYFGRLGLRLSSEFTGAAFFILGILGLLYGTRRRLKYALASLCVIGAVVSWGGYTPVFSVLYAILPVFRKLRAPHMAAFVTASALALAAGPGFDALFVEQNKDRLRRKTAIILACASLLFLILTPAAGSVSRSLQSSWWAGHGVTDTSPYAGLTARRTSLLETDFLRVFAASGILALALFLRGKNRGGPAVFAGAVIVLSLFELVPFNRSFQVYLHNKSIESMFPGAPALQEMAGGGRVFPGGNSLMPLGLRSVTGYHAAKTMETDRLMNLVYTGSPWVLYQTGMTVLATGEGAATWQEMWPVLSEDAEQLPREPMPRAFIPRSSVSGSAEEGFLAVERGWNPRVRSIIENAPSFHDGVLGAAEITTDLPERVTIETNTASDGYLVLADTWYPMWSAAVDGAETQVFRANGWMRAVPIPAGEHVVEFSYETGHIKTGALVSLMALAACGALVFIPGKKRSHA